MPRLPGDGCDGGGEALAERTVVVFPPCPRACAELRSRGLVEREHVLDRGLEPAPIPAAPADPEAAVAELLDLAAGALAAR